jgi:protein-S-isoprenylcysteine O-methyltransferase Ste14
MPAISLSSHLRRRPADTLAALGLISGLLSGLWGASLELPVLQPLAALFFLDPGMLPIGFFFGAAMAIGIALWTRSPWALLAVPIATMYAWSAALHTAIRLQRNSGDDAHLIAASLCAGAVGAGLTHLGCALFAADLRRPWWRLALTCGVGAVAGLLFYLGERKYVDERLLFFVWQPAVAFCIGLGLPRSSQTT